jgi:hypothetical protein
MRTSETIKEIAPAYAAFRASCPNPPKNKTNNHIGNSYSTLDIIIETAQPHLTENKLFVIQDVKTEGAKVSTQTTICHESGEFFEFEPVVLTATKDTAQQIGSAMTYGRRYSISIALGIASQEDDDGQEASQPQGNNRQNNSGQGQHRNASNPTAISDSQKKKLGFLIKEKAELENVTDEVFFKDHLQKAMNVKTPTKSWSRAQASQAITLLENWGKNKEESK